MTEENIDDLYRAALKDRRKRDIRFILALIVIVAVMGTGWTLSAIGRDTWQAQAVYWQEWGTGLYDEYTAATGEEPDADEPAQVAKAGPQGEPGEPGLPGVAGVPGDKGDKGDAGIPGFKGDSGLKGDTGLPGATGSQGEPGPVGGQGEPGQSGPQGEPGATGATGPAGPTGPAGVACPVGSTSADKWIQVSDTETGPFTPTLATICLPTPTGVTP